MMEFKHLNSVKTMRPINYAINNIKDEKILLKVVEMLLDFGADTRTREGEHGMTSIMFAIVHDYHDVFNTLIKIPGVLSDKWEGGTILMIVAATGRGRMLEQLLKYGVDIEEVNDSGGTALMLATSSGHDGVVRMLLEAGAKTDTKGGENMLTPLMCAAEEGYLKIVNELLKAGADPDVRHECGWTALTFAADGNHEEIVERLLGKSPKFDDLNLALTYSFNNCNMTRSLLLAGANPNAAMSNIRQHMHMSSKFTPAWYDLDDSKPTDGTTTLMWASSKGHEDVVELLLKAGANTDAKNDDGNTALMMAKSNGHEKILSRLLEAGPTVDWREKPSESLL